MTVRCNKNIKFTLKFSLIRLTLALIFLIWDAVALIPLTFGGKVGRQITEIAIPVLTVGRLLPSHARSMVAAPMVLSQLMRPNSLYFYYASLDNAPVHFFQ